MISHMACYICEGPVRYVLTLSEPESKRSYGVWSCRACRYEFLHPYKPTHTRAARDQYTFWTDGLEAKVAGGFVRLFRKCVPLKTGRVLDVGCGEGHFARGLAEEGYAAEGMDIDPHAVDAAKKRYPSQTFIWTDMDRLAPEQAYDAITLWQVLEHIPDPVQAVRIMQRWLQPGGYLLVNVPHSNDLMKAIAFIPYYLLRWSRPLRLFYSPDHINHFSEKALREVFKRCGFRVERANQSESYITLFSLAKFPAVVRPFLKALALCSRLLRREAVITLVAQKISTPEAAFGTDEAVSKPRRRAA